MKSDYIRLNLTSVQDFPHMFIEKSMEFYGIEISELMVKVSYSDVSNSHGCPINGVTNWGGRLENQPRSYPGWSGNIKFNSKSKKNNRDFFLDSPIKFRGFHTGAGCPGRINEYKTDIAFYFFLEDFPILKKNKEKHKILGSFEKDKVWSEQILIF